MKNKGVVINQSAIKAMNIIDLLARNGNAMRLNDIAKELNMNQSTALRFLYALRTCGYVEQNEENSKYHLTLKVHAIASCVDDNISYLRETAHPYLHALRDRFNETICLGVERDMKIVYIDVVAGPLARSKTRIGNASSMHSTGIGKLLMLNYSNDQLDAWERQMGFKIFTPNTIRSHDELVSCLNEARRNDYAFDNEECEKLAFCIAVPIRDYTNKIIAGISVSGSKTSLTEELIDKNKEFLIETARQISWRMGYQRFLQFSGNDEKHASQEYADDSVFS